MNTVHGAKDEVLKYTRNASEKKGKQASSIFGALKASRKTILLIVIVAIVSIAGSALVSILLTKPSSDVYLPSLGTIKTIDVEAYWDASCTKRRETLDWGEIETGKSVNTTLYIKSVSNFEVGLNLKITDWNPQGISDYITITWDYNGTRLNPGEVIPVTMNLSASSSESFINYLVDNEIRQFTVDVHFIASD